MKKLNGPGKTDYSLSALKALKLKNCLNYLCPIESKTFISRFFKKLALIIIFKDCRHPK
jgi:hypothetical protein